MTFLKLKKTVFLVISMLLILTLFPYFLYKLGLSNVTGRPERATNERDGLNSQGGIIELTKFKKLTPYNYFDTENTGFERVIWVVARDYNSNNLKSKRMLWWHLSGVSMTIWLSRNWAPEEILIKANAIRHKVGMTPGSPT